MKGTFFSTLRFSMQNLNLFLIVFFTLRSQHFPHQWILTEEEQQKPETWPSSIYGGSLGERVSLNAGWPEEQRGLSLLWAQHNEQTVTLAQGELSAGVFSSTAGRQISLPGDNTHLCVGHMTWSPLWELHWDALEQLLCTLKHRNNGNGGKNVEEWTKPSH